MTVRLGPMPAHLCEIVRRWIENGKEADSHYIIEPRISALLITGGGFGASYLDGNGELWDWFFDDESPGRVRDESRKLLLALIAVECWPELAGWIPSRPTSATDCRKCRGTGKLTLTPDFVDYCGACNGLGWT